MRKRERGREIKGKKTKEKPRAKIYIFAEGDTEEIYLKHFEVKEYNAEVIAKDPKCTDAVGIVARARNFMKEEKLDLELGDRVYCVFDSDPLSNPNIQLAFDMIRGMAEEGMRCIFSNPSFEVWFILHLKERVPYGLTAIQLKEHLRRALKPVFPNYSETTDIFDWLRDKQSLAYEREEHEPVTVEYGYIILNRKYIKEFYRMNVIHIQTCFGLLNIWRALKRQHLADE